MDRSITSSCFQCNAPSETQRFGGNFAKTLSKGTTVAFYGDLGSGKTTCIKSIVSYLTNLHTEEILSPTFNFVNEYDGVYHFDLYRMNNYEEFLQRGFDEYLLSGSICLIEWAERIEGFLPKNRIKLRFKMIDETTRLISIEP
ncbi:MAG: tRNA (adenosine(37)-N6)-threonylcarbamoyltransferase complex ATPase subunit type 1 TsaE [Simkaniaceae bacterium]|nr:tRNA (adenosine(37)-N6)-threonylcarbamoyltransferase complex ATPase subunit type 1 TsaE [Simkaniaceae bacterium]